MQSFNFWLRDKIKKAGWNNRSFCRAAGVGESVSNPSYDWCPKVNTMMIMVETLVAREIKKLNLSTPKETTEMFDQLLWEAITSTKEYSASINQLTKDVQNEYNNRMF